MALTLSVNGVKSHHDEMITSDNCSTSYRENHQKWLECFWKRRKFATKWYTIYFVFTLNQPSEIVLQS